LVELVIVIIVLGVLAAVAIPKFVNLRSEATTSAGSGILAAAHDAVNIYHSACQIRNGNAGKVDIDGIQSMEHGSCYPALEAKSKLSNGGDCFNMFNLLLDAGDLIKPANYSQGSNGWTAAETVTKTYLTDSQDNGYQLYIHQRTGAFSYCHFYYIDGVDLSQTPYLLFDGDTGRMAKGVMDVSTGINWGNSLKLYN